MSNQTASDVISFKERAMADPVKPIKHLLGVELTIPNIDVSRILVDTGSSANIIFKNTLERMEISLSGSRTLGGSNNDSRHNQPLA